MNPLATEHLAKLASVAGSMGGGVVSNMLYGGGLPGAFAAPMGVNAGVKRVLAANPDASPAQREAVMDAPGLGTGATSGLGGLAGTVAGAGAGLLLGGATGAGLGAVSDVASGTAEPYTRTEMQPDPKATTWNAPEVPVEVQHEAFPDARHMAIPGAVIGAVGGGLAGGGVGSYYASRAMAERAANNALAMMPQRNAR